MTNFRDFFMPNVLMFFPSYLNQSPENNVSHVSLNINLNHGSTSPGDMVILVLSLKY